MNITKKLFTTLTCLTVFLFFLSGVSVVYADDPSTGNNPDAPRQSITDILMGRDTGTKILGDRFFQNIKSDPREIVRDVIFIVFGFLGTLMVCLVLYSGFLWMTASGDSEKIKSAQGHLRSAIIGIIIVMSAWTISIFVLNALKETVKGDVSAESSSGGATGGVGDAVNPGVFCAQYCNDSMFNSVKAQCITKCTVAGCVNVTKCMCSVDAAQTVFCSKL